ncbi:N-6 DNA methylase [Yeosuana sp. MJ-SS3]|uniref:site-specific DNA-methyltransferase (adenine-specific) n=1 Tax=Gilvirhabdus luticola TaxID=3079858 RepID=A0ABU3U4D3_9FLAO|nr:N-6 DNA methylase [Yeosuana sp. MJ-SS3]MDU8885206.1 N-6 DNA methylase [Yeosuana sp. MJ-SS3]
MSKINELIQSFSNTTLIAFLRQQIPTFKPDDDDLAYLFDDEIFDKYLSINKVGEATINGDDLIVITSETSDPLTERTGKKKQYEIAKQILKHEVKDAALFVFYDVEGNFRFSFVKANYLGTKRNFTDFKRYTYYITPDRTNRTFIKQVGGCNFNSLDEIIEAFSVEPLNKQFYQEIAKAFYSLIGGKIKIGSRNQEFDTVLKLPSTPSAENRKLYQEFSVRLIGRTIFCWFLRNKKSENHIPLIPENWLSSSTVELLANGGFNYYHDYLEKVFFLILNKKVDDRKDFDLPDGHELIPFLNGGLFEPHIDDFFGNNGKPNYGLDIPNIWFLDLFKILEQYNFTIDENSIYDAEVSIDPEMLGTIFENLLAEIDPDTEKSARKATGSFYTPREIVDYMVEQSLIQYLKTKTNIENEEQLQELFKEGGENRFNPFETKKILQALGDVKILDPACGSGAFPMGALHKIINALHKLDPDVSWWKERQLENIPNVLARKMLKEKLDTASADYVRKLGIIQNSIYGVDIQPIAAEISKLRSFLSLVIDENIDDNAENRGIEPLPNLEFKFVTANTLLGLEEKNISVIDFGQTEPLQDELQRIRNDYLQAYGIAKVKLKEQFELVQSQIYKNEVAGGGQNKRALQLAAWKPFSHESNSWFDPYWMYGFDKFDIIIGNPPYNQLQKEIDDSKKLADIYQDLKYLTFERSGDIYCLFYENSINLLSNNGFVCLITSNKWMRAKYGKSLRKLFLKYNPIQLIDLGPGVFNSATVDTNILILQNETNRKIQLNAIELKKNKDLNNLNDKFTEINSLSEESWIILSKEKQKIKQKIDNKGKALKKWGVNINRGVLTGLNEAFIIDEKCKNDLIFNEPEAIKFIRPLLKGRDVQRYKILDNKLWLIGTFPSRGIDIDRYPYLKNYLEKFWPKIKQSGEKIVLKDGTKVKTRKKTKHQWFETQDQINYFNEFDKEFIVWAETIKIYFDGSRNFPRFTITENVYLDKTCFFMTTNENNKKYILSILNSKLFEFYILNLVMTLGSGSLGLQKNYIETIPIPEISSEKQKTFSDVASIILDKKKLNQNTSEEELKLDVMVYKLYDISFEEIITIDPTFYLSQSEYNNFDIIK